MPLSYCRLYISIQNQTKSTMRIAGKKDKVDVKKFIEEMKANRTNRSYTSLESRHRQKSEEPKDRFASKYRPENIDPYRPMNPPPQPIRPNFEQAPRYQPSYAPIYPPRNTPDYAPSQIFTATPPFQYPGMVNYSQNFNSQVYPPVFPPNSMRYDQNFGAEMDSGFYQPQSRALGSRIAPAVQQNALERTNSLPELNHQPISASKPKQPSLQPARNNQIKEIPNTSENIVEKKEEAKEEIKAVVTPEPVKKKRKPKEKKPVDVTPQKVTKEVEKEKTIQVEELNTASISRKFDEMLAAEKKKIEEKAINEAKFKEIMKILNARITSVMNKHLAPEVVNKISALGEHVKQIERFDTRDDVFQLEVASFECEMMTKIKEIS